MSDVIISVEGLGKKYVLSHQGGERGGYSRFSERLEDWVKRPFRSLAAMGSRISDIGYRKAGAPLNPISHIQYPSTREEFWALKDVSFEVKRGEVVGIIGRNGAGKSTLLKILSRITEPTEGRVTLRGRVASLLEVGTGFHPELTGRENIFLNGAILGMSKAEIRKKFDEIVAFAEVERFLDTPVKRYSSGMYVRLAFAVAAHLEPEILVVDEVLAVGDFEFQKKCMGKMKDVATGGRTVLFVSHNMAAIKVLCSQALLLQKGRVLAFGQTNEVIHKYLSRENPDLPELKWTKPEEAPGNENVRLKSVRVRSGGKIEPFVDICHPAEIEIEFWNLTACERAWTGIQLKDALGAVIFISINRGSAASGEDPHREKPLKPGVYRSTLTLPANFLNEGEYRILAAVQRQGTHFEAVTREDLVFRTTDSGRMRSEHKGSWDGSLRPLLPWKTEMLAG